MAGALAAHRDLVGEIGREDDQRLGVEPAVLDEAERQGIDASAPGCFGQAIAGRGERIGEPGAVHVQREPAPRRQLADRRDFGGSIHEAIFGGVGDRDRGGLDLVHVVADAIAGRVDRVGRQLGALPVQQDQLGAAGEEAGRARLVDLDVRVLVAEDRPVRRAQGGERQAVGGGTGRHPEGADLGSEQIGEGAVEAAAPLVAIICRVDPVRPDNSLEHLGVGGCRVIGEEAHREAR